MFFSIFFLLQLPGHVNCFLLYLFFHRSPSGRVFLLFFVKRFTCLLKGSHQLC